MRDEIHAKIILPRKIIIPRMEKRASRAVDRFLWTRKQEATFAARNYSKRSHLFPGRREKKWAMSYAIRARARARDRHFDRVTDCTKQLRKEAIVHLEILSCRATIALGVTFSFSCTASPHLMLSTTPAVPLSSRNSGSRR